MLTRTIGQTLLAAWPVPGLVRGSSAMGGVVRLEWLFKHELDFTTMMRPAWLAVNLQCHSTSACLRNDMKAVCGVLQVQDCCAALSRLLRWLG